MEHQLQIKIPCWVIADSPGDDVQKASQIVLMQSNGRHILQVFLEKPEAERFMREAGLTDKVALTIGSIQHLHALTDHLQKQGAHEVQLFFQLGEEFKRASVPIGDFNDGLRKHLSQPNN